MKILLIKTERMKPLQITEKHLEKLRDVDKNIEVTAVSYLDKQKIAEQLIYADIISGVPWVIPSIKNAKKLKWIHTFSAGMDRVLTPEVLKSKIMLSNSSGIHAIPIAEHVLGFMLIFTRRFYETFQKQQKKIWEKNQNITELRGKTLLVVGLGNIGTEIARTASCLGMNVLGVKQNVKNKPSFVSKAYTINQLDNVLPKADFVVISLPLTPNTKHLFNINKFKKMKKSAVIMNIGRGPLIKETDLILALEKKIIAGAGLDVTEVEPLSKESKLWNMENVIITPHHSGWSEKYMDRAIDRFVLNLKAYIAGKPLPNLVDKKRGY